MSGDWGTGGRVNWSGEIDDRCPVERFAGSDDTWGGCAVRARWARRRKVGVADGRDE